MFLRKVDVKGNKLYLSDPPFKKKANSNQNCLKLIHVPPVYFL